MAFARRAESSLSENTGMWIKLLSPSIRRERGLRVTALGLDAREDEKGPPVGALLRCRLLGGDGCLVELALTLEDQRFLETRRGSIGLRVCRRPRLRERCVEVARVYVLLAGAEIGSALVRQIDHHQRDSGRHHGAYAPADLPALLLFGCSRRRPPRSSAVGCHGREQEEGDRHHPNLPEVVDPGRYGE